MFFALLLIYLLCLGTQPETVSAKSVAQAAQRRCPAEHGSGSGTRPPTHRRTTTPAFAEEPSYNKYGAID